MPPTAPATNADLLIDIGNSRAKLALFGDGRLRHHGVVREGDTEGLRAFLGGIQLQRIGVGSVARETGWDKALSGLAPVVTLTGTSRSPLQVTYDPPQTLGVDRLANAVAAHTLFPDRTALAVDLGSCITFDLVTAEGRYEGGAISPGAHMRARAMNSFSARLPLVDPFGAGGMVRRTTEGSLQSGIHQGIVHELKGWIGAMRDEHQDLAVVLTGGDAPRFSRALKSGIFAVPLLTLLGLHVLLEHTNGHGSPDRRAGVR